MRLARAADRAGADRVDVDREADLGEPRVDVADRLLGDAREHEVLLARDADVAARRLREVGELDHLAPADEPDVHGDADRAPAVVLQPDAHVVVVGRGHAAAA